MQNNSTNIQNKEEQKKTANAAQPVRRQLTAEQKRAVVQRRAQREKLKQKKRNRLLMAAAAALLVIVIALIVLLCGGKEDKVGPTLGSLEPLPTESPTDVPTAEPTATPVPQPTPFVAAEAEAEPFDYDVAYAQAVNQEDTGALITPDYSLVDPAKRSLWPDTKEGYMPVLKKIETNEKVIAITIDDCYQADNLRGIVQTALDNSGKLTIFPIGMNIAKDNIGLAVKWAWENGMELENHTYHHEGLYHYDDETMAREIYQQNTALNRVLGVNYRVHFFRPHGGDERDDQRVQAYINQLGYYGVAHWSYCGSTSSIEATKNNLRPGQIYLFHTTNDDLAKLREFIPYAAENGYRMVTLNEMFGLPDNETYDISTWNSDTPMLRSFHVTPVAMKKTTYSRAAAVVQRRLIHLGWLKGDADGEFGKGTEKAIMAFQKACGFEQSGKATAETQIKLFSDSAPKK